MSTFNVPKREEVNENNQAIFDNLEKAIGFVPNLYAAMAYSKNGLGEYLKFSNTKLSLSAKEKEAVDLAVSQVNGCLYCQSAHTATSKLKGYTDEQILELRQGRASWDAKLNALASISKEIAETSGKVSESAKDAFYNAGYTKENLVDLTFAYAIITVTNTLHNLTDVAIDFPLAQPLEIETV
ncbi:carboxymuconolactone decarboxylase family protein [Postechiella marina]|uniref:Carboxymuconolactone decarboxylase family protein n=1 Tax=Postechiella marina TaxID=943941 RepID=A0ABP8C8X0_9FLAO